MSLKAWMNLAEFGRHFSFAQHFGNSLLGTLQRAHLEGMCQVQIDTIWGMKKGQHIRSPSNLKVFPFLLR